MWQLQAASGEVSAETARTRLGRAPRRATFQPRLGALCLAVGLLWLFAGCSPSFVVWRQPGVSSESGPADSAVVAQRRQLLAGLGLLGAAPAAPAFAFESYTDTNNGYEIKYPLGLQKSASKQYDYLLRDIIEPLEFVGVKVTKTTRNSLDEVGPVQEVAAKLLKDLVPEGAPQEILKAESKETRTGRRQDIIEFAYQWKFDENLARQLGRRRFQLHCKALVTVANQKQYLVLYATEEPRWSVRSEDYETVHQTFRLIYE